MTDLIDRFGMKIPLFAFSRTPAVVAEVTRAGGMGILGAIGWRTDELGDKLDWIASQVGDLPWGVDVVMPRGYVSAGSEGMGEPSALRDLLPPKHRAFIDRLLDEHGVPPLPADATTQQTMLHWTDAVSRRQVEMSLEYPISLIANALGPPPPDVVDAAHDKGVLVAALVGSVMHARAQVAAGVDVIVAQGTEAGGHCGEISTFVLVPAVVEAVSPVPVLAAGGVGNGAQIAAALALGAQGAWTGSIWLTTEEALEPPVLRDKLLAAGYRDTVRSRSISGKPARQLKTGWSEAWDSADTPDPLPMPLQPMLVQDAWNRIRCRCSSCSPPTPSPGSTAWPRTGSTTSCSPHRWVRWWER